MTHPIYPQRPIAACGVKYNRKESVAVIPIGSDKKYLVSREGLLRFSKLARDLLQDAEWDEPLQLNNPHCTEECVSAFAVWINKHASLEVPVRRISFPLPSGELHDIFMDWDLQFVHSLLVPGGDMRQSKTLCAFAGLSKYLNIPILQELCCGYFAWWIRKVADDSKDGGPPVPAVVGSWFGIEGNVTEDELKGFMEKYAFISDCSQIEKDSETTQAVNENCHQREKIIF